MANDKTEEFQKQARELLRAQQEAYLEAVKAWREAAAGMQLPQSPQWPQPPQSPEWPQPPLWQSSAPLDTLPTADEVAKMSYTFAASLLADQSRFLEELSRAMKPKEET